MFLRKNTHIETYPNQNGNQKRGMKCLTIER